MPSSGTAESLMCSNQQSLHPQSNHWHHSHSSRHGDRTMLGTQNEILSMHICKYYVCFVLRSMELIEYD